MSVVTAAGEQSREGRATRKDWFGLVVLAFSVLLISIDGTVLDLALPFVSADLAPSSTALLWIIDVYSFVLAGLLVTMGTLGDRIGRRRLLMIGAVGFGIASAIAAFSVSPEMLIGARVLQGISGATLMPATLALIRTIFVDARQRTAAIGVWGAMAGGGAAGGPLVGGWLLEHFWWGSVFLINVPVMFVLVLVGPLVIPESKDPTPGRFDLVSAALSIAAIVPLVYAVKESVVHGPSRSLLAIGLLGLLAGWIFVRRQRTLADPMIDLGLFAGAAFTTAVLTNLLSVFALAGVLFFGSQYLQLVLDFSPLAAGLLLLPGTAMSIVASLAASRLIRRWTSAGVLAFGLASGAIGALLLIGLRVDSGPALFIAGFVLVGYGAGISLTLTSALVVGSVEPERAGAASAISETGYELGIALGVAVLGSVVMGIFRGGLDVSALSADNASAARETLGSAVQIANDQSDDIALAVLDSAHAAFVDGMHVASGITAVIMFVTAGLVLRLLRP